jgi:hypothetical protein
VPGGADEPLARHPHDRPPRGCAGDRGGGGAQRRANAGTGPPADPAILWTVLIAMLSMAVLATVRVLGSRASLR